MRKEHWDCIGGLNPLYKGWGNEDEDLRERLRLHGYIPHRNEVGTFLCLHHEDNGNIAAKPKEEQEDFILGRQMLANFKAYKHLGYKSVTADIEEFKTDIPNVRWIKNTNYKVHENIN